MRLGTYYRNLMWEILVIKADGKRVLDVGGFDGYWISRQPAETKVCVDIDPQQKHQNVIYVKASALDLPFEDEYFDQVFAFDLIEHVNNDKRLLRELHRVTRVNGRIIISTPHKNIYIFPKFLTNWVSQRWGHYRVNGYLENEIREILPDGDIAEFSLLREIFFRAFYLPLRLLWGISENISKPIVRAIAYLDTAFLNGGNGHIVTYLTRGNQ